MSTLPLLALALTHGDVGHGLRLARCARLAPAAGVGPKCSWQKKRNIFLGHRFRMILPGFSGFSVFLYLVFGVLYVFGRAFKQVLCGYNWD